MRTTQQFSITLPNEMADAVKAKVMTGEYATESEVIRDGLRALMARDRAVENWLRGQVGPAIVPRNLNLTLARLPNRVLETIGVSLATSRQSSGSEAAT